ncbi:MAG: peptide-methionine (S)-S-oxide reductase MsrA [Sterolibacterium sp.]|jgi:peptide-methionine (S)-S-oxide reductase
MGLETEHELATLGGGCFWCLEAVFLRLKGVESVVSGYSGGRTANPSYRDICAGNTGHAEVVQVRFDPARIAYADLLEVFFAIHDPTTLNRQGNDVGTQYRSVIFTHSAEQASVAARSIAALTAARAYADPIATEVLPIPTFYPAEDYHQDYFANNPRQPYCQAVVAPKLAKFLKKFGDRAS